MIEFRTKTEQDMAKALIASERALIADPSHQEKYGAIKTACPYLVTAYIIDAFWDQDVARFVYLINDDTIAVMEGPPDEDTETNGSWRVTVQSLAQYTHKRTMLKQQRILIDVAKQLARDAVTRKR